MPGMSDFTRQLLAHRKTEFYALLVVAILFPFLVLAVFGLVFIWQQGWIMYFLALLLLSATILAVAAWAFKRLDTDDGRELQTLEPRAGWGSEDRRVWALSTQRIASSKLADTPWPDLQQEIITQMVFVAQCYHGDKKDAEYAVSLPEFLLMLEVCSRNYRALISQRIPLSHKLKLSTMRAVYRQREAINTSYGILHLGYRLFRVAGNAPMAVLSELRGAVLGTMTDGLSAHMQKNLKKLLFEEVSQVAIDLYSGRLKLSSEELRHYQQQVTAPLEPVAVKPISVVLIGQVNAGKSSLINALAEQCVAEIDVIETGEAIVRHRLQLTDELELELVDTPGINSDSHVAKQLLHEAAQADLVLWLSQANQPAKELDRQLLQRWQAYFSQHIERRMPPILLVTTHNDQLSPKAQWRPPYDMNDISSRKVATMLQAIRYTQQALQLAEDSSVVAISVAPDKDSYNVGSVKDLILGLSEDARASQLNKDRVQAAQDAPLLKTVWGQLRGMGRVVGTLVREQQD
jgi:predicted GTPase